MLPENLTLGEAVASTRYPHDLCRIHLDRFRELGTITETHGRYRLTTGWQRPVIRLLRRRNLLPD